VGEEDIVSNYYDSQDLNRFGEIGKHRKELADKFFAYYGAVMEKGALTKREKNLIALAVAHAIQCPYCIDSYSQSCLESGSSMDEVTEAIHIAAAMRAGASLVHGIQAHNSIDKVMM
jgi:4-carboxymuconolactone decarboxylase